VKCEQFLPGGVVHDCSTTTTAAGTTTTCVTMIAPSGSLPSQEQIKEIGENGGGCYHLSVPSKP